MSQSSSTSVAAKTQLLSNGTYNKLKHVAQIGLPLLAALYYSLSLVWHFPDVSQVMMTVATVNTVLGLLLGYSTATYNASEAKYAGAIEVIETDAKKIFSLNLNQVPEEIEKMAEATFRIVSTTAPVQVAGPDLSSTGSTPTTAHGASQ